jgi:excisionase family DNA binding protein
VPIQNDIPGVNGLEPLLTTSETGVYLRTSIRSVQRLTQSGRLRHVRIGGRVRVPRSALVEFVEGGMLPSRNSAGRRAAQDSDQ